MNIFVQELKKIVSNNIYIMNLSYRISPKRIIYSGLWRAMYFFEWIFFSGYFMKKIVYMIEGDCGIEEIIKFIFITVGIFLFINIFNSWYENVVKPESEIEVYHGLYSKLYQKAQNADLSCYENHAFYDKYMMAIADADKRLLVTIDNFWAIVMGFVAVLASWYLMIKIDMNLIFFIIAPLLGNFVFATALNKISYQIYEESVIYQRIADYVNRVVHLVDYAKDIRLTGIFHVMQQKHEKSVKGMTDIIDRYKKKSVLYGWAYMFLTYTSLFEGVLFYGIYRTIVSKSMSLAEFTVLSGLMVAVSSVLIDFTEALLSCYKNSFFIENMKSFLSYEPVIPEDTDGFIPDDHIRKIEFRNVSFGYHAKRKILKNINFCVEEGMTCALVGFNGAGKTTLIKLLLRLYDPTEGEILVNDIDIRKYQLTAYRKLFATAFQDGKLFARSIRENIWMDNNDKAMNEIEDRIWESLDLAGIKELVEQLSFGLDTVISKEFDEEGVVLSGGEIQKLIAARAFIENKPVMVFDEPSSALDPIAESRLFESITKAKGRKTLFFISHRLSSVQEANLILMLRNGRIIERGTHQELMQLKGEYEHLFQLQAKKYQDEIERAW